MRAFSVRRMSVVLVALALLVTGLSGAYSYWESYYQHRGFATVALVAGARQGRLVTVNFHSQALGRQADYFGYLPPSYDPAARRYPVLYLLHGSPGRPQVYFAIAHLGIRLDNLVAEHRMRPMILIFPDGRIGGSTFSDSEWANTQAGNYESYVLDVVRDVDQRFSTIADRGGRVIAGFSAGGYGATNVVLRNLGVFGNLESWSGYYLQTRHGVFAHATAAQLAANSPLVYVRELGPQLAAEPLRAFLFVGRDDDVSPQTEPMARALAARGASVSYALYHGGHDWQLWHAHLNQMLILASQDVSEPLRGGRGSAGTLTPGVTPIPHGAGRHRGHRAKGRRRVGHGGPMKLRRPRGAPAPLSIPPGSAPPSPLGPAPFSAAALSARGELGLGELLGGLLLALGSAALINLGFLLQHRGLGDREAIGLAATLRGAVHNPTWLTGQLLGWVGFGAQIVAVAIAPLSLVQAFAAGGLALSVPLAAGFFSHRITRSQLAAVMMIAASLAVLPIGFSTARDHLHGGALGVSVLVAALAGIAVSALRGAPLRAIAAGVFYGVADAAIKAISIGWGAHGASALLSVWTPVAALATFGGFLAFQTALRGESAISSISLMNAFATLVALACGLLAFGESLGADPVAVIAHLAAIGVVLGCVPVLAAAQAEMAQTAEHPDGRSSQTPPSPPSLQPRFGSPG
ncbi:MAG: alpha/beta hydrolase-fold protein [Solirubrobacteraceae bacterium]